MPTKTYARRSGPRARSDPAPKGLRDLKNVGPATEKDFKILGISLPAQLVGKDPVKLYERLCRVTGVRHDPCCLDVFMAAVDEASGKRGRPWWEYTKKRKAMMAARDRAQ